MSSTAVDTPKQQMPSVQRSHALCRTQQQRRRLIVLIYLLVLLVGIGAIASVFAFTGAHAYRHPKFEPEAVQGMPQVDEKYAYSKLEIDDGYTIYVNGVIPNDGQRLELDLTNAAENTIWLRAEISDENGKLLGSSGVLKQGEYLPAITLKEPLAQRETPIAIKIIAYEPDEWTSRGSITLNVTVYRDYR